MAAASSRVCDEGEMCEGKNHRQKRKKRRKGKGAEMAPKHTAEKRSGLNRDAHEKRGHVSL